MSHDEAIEWLFSLHRFGMKLGLENIRILLDALGRPQDSFDCVLVAGTNGKGSTAAMIHAALVAAEVRSGLYTSPHLLHTEERIRIGEVDIPPEDLAAQLSEVRSCIDRLLRVKALAVSPTFFEVLTAAGLLAFARAGVEVAVLEVGLGGRLDATNAVSPVLSVITSIDLDHQEQLGSTLAAIAREKAGILRRGVPGLLGDIDDEPLRTIRAEAAAAGAPLILAADGCTLDVRGANAARAASAATPCAQTFALTTPVRHYPSLACPLPGAHQISNALLAVRAAEILSDRLAACGPVGSASPEAGQISAHETVPSTPASLDRPHPRGRSINAGSIVTGIAAVRWPGRLEWIASNPRLLLDGAHNVAGCRVLSRYLAGLPARPVLLFAAMRDKDAGTMLEILLPRVSSAVFTMPPTSRACDPSELLELARNAAAGLGRPTPLPGRVQGDEEIALLREAPPASLEIGKLHNPAEILARLEAEAWFADGDVGAALDLARRLAGPGGTVLVAGSLFLVGAVKEVLAGLPVRAGALS